MTLPNFVIAGERRCGTTTLADRLSSHPQIYVHAKRDSGFFVDTHIRKGGPPSDWDSTHSVQSYQEFFGEAARQSQKMISEKSADYLYFLPAHERIANYLPNTKFIFILRNPILRAWSHYWNEIGKGRETLSFSDAVKAENDRVSAKGFEGYHLSYVSRGFYQRHLNHFFRFVPQARCHVVILESLISEPHCELNKITSFLGVSGFVPPLSHMRSNSNWTMVHRSWASRQPARGAADIYLELARAAAKILSNSRDDRRRLSLALSKPFFQQISRMTMDEKTRSELMEVFEPHTQKLEAMLGRPLSSWRHYFTQKG